ncbi:DUF222 domain-containing protein [Phytoactinopolyspora alkaliphila]|uniref:DUF222 domain-containing protein n=1 Tax=Phytoactinopolyspora alkaliphila TaxID=1783498 RepID=A0A6N9YGI7_9ACTN|nr:HNH endonuclease signature motif containing protein [Phytoactinopolyspora alkaliphila]NED94074.1 DUF222 domain-containing protein [Phytoactinopolyspora alkaliphila]
MRGQSRGVRTAPPEQRPGRCGAVGATDDARGTNRASEGSVAAGAGRTVASHSEHMAGSDVDARWRALVEAEFEAAEMTATAMGSTGVNAHDVADRSAAGEGLGAADRDEDGFGATDHDTGWLAANGGLLEDLPGGEESAWADVSPGVELAGVLRALPPAHMSAYHLADAVAGWEKLIAWAQAQQAAAAAELTRRPEVQASDPDARSASLHPVPVTAGDLCTVWPWTKPQSERIVDWSVQLVGSFPAVHKALAEGRIDARRARIITDALRDHDIPVRRMVEAAVLPHVHAWTSVKVSYVVNRLLAELAPEQSKDCRRKARQKRRVWIEPDADGMAWLYAYLPAEDAEAIMTALNAAANNERRHERRGSRDTRPRHAGPDRQRDNQPGGGQQDSPRDGQQDGRHDRPRDGQQDGRQDSRPDGRHDRRHDGPDSRHSSHSGGGMQSSGNHDARDSQQSDLTSPAPARTLDQLRADMLAGLAWASLRTGYLGGTACAGCGSPFGFPLSTAHGHPVSVNVTVALSTLIGLDEHPGELDGYGPVDADTARHLAAAGVWRWVGTHPTGGHALDYGRTRYTPPQDLVDFVLLRDRECQMPGCHRPARRCQIDHRDPYPHGPTAACNCSALCQPCHLQKHRAGWTVEQLRPGVQRWTSPTGHPKIVKLPRLAPDPPGQPPRGQPPPF